jgi:hypothetical protein
LTISLAHRTELTATSLAELARGDIEVIWHRNFFPAAHCDTALPRIVAACERSSYTLSKDLESLGTSMGEACESDALAERYLNGATATTALIRDTIFAGLPSPTDMVRLRVDELWPAGASVARFRGRMMLPGLIRRWPRGGHANPHIDQRDVPLLSDLGLVRRIGVNVYLQVPEPGHGGELDFWGVFDDEQDYVALKRPDYGLDRDRLGPPRCSILPAQGDLLMFDVARVHGVRRVDVGSRVTAACFLGVRGAADPLVIFA